MKIILENPNENFKGPIICPSCKCKFKYTKDEEKTKVCSDGWEIDVCSYTSCPNCGNNVNTNQI